MHSTYLQVSSAEEYPDIINNLGIPNPDMMYEAVPENLQVGLEDIALDTKERTLPANETLNRLPAGSALCIDLRRQSERKKIGVIL